MQKIEDGCVVSLAFTLSDDEGNILDESPDDEALVYMHGAAGIVPALEEALEGKVAGDAFDVTLLPEDAYGDYLEEAVVQIARDQVREGQPLELGMQVEDSSGQHPPRLVTGLTETTVTLDSNHPLAGLTLRFQGTVAEVRRATDEELAQV
ncbi:peptidylprolyl isomerase [Halieaceae bacterium IMCC14734]|uniref:Peptidyl-prolyl cis-trans isomerase n=1 Tax=Candidatus Litorirhabdus singularis TaxID=2518993 RepID=A0ABT3TF83_9GAMM|nr:peptidylprolyl isomerase [Candidatus Litorirhabdus singularis]MCX2980978.1 peptidylprolyl isomerase [Candidatus Litorirhabdus singularis]